MNVIAVVLFLLLGQTSYGMDTNNNNVAGMPSDALYAVAANIHQEPDDIFIALKFFTASEKEKLEKLKGKERHEACLSMATSKKSSSFPLEALSTLKEGDYVELNSSCPVHKLLIVWNQKIFENATFQDKVKWLKQRLAKRAVVAELKNGDHFAKLKKLC